MLEQKTYLSACQREIYLLKTMTYQLESSWSEHTPQYKKEMKRLENNIVETTGKEEKSLVRTGKNYLS